MGGAVLIHSAVIPAKFSHSALALFENASREPVTPVSPCGTTEQPVARIKRGDIGDAPHRLVAETTPAVIPAA
jgi:hypothetical protein